MGPRPSYKRGQGAINRMNNSDLHYAIINSFIKRQCAPSIDSLATKFDYDRDEVVTALDALADYHGVVLHPTTREVWVAHPFSSTPTPFIVRSGTKRWWGNCAWCSLGLVHLIGGSATIETRIGGIGDPIEIRLENGKLIDDELVVHFPMPMKSAWDSVIYTCSLMLVFRSEVEVDDWCTVRSLPRGDARPIQQIWNFASEWYSRHADRNWEKWSIAEAIEIFRRHHLTHPVWQIANDGGRF